MNQQILTVIIRHSLTAVGGGLIASWGLNGSDVDMIAGALATIGAVAWSIYEKKQPKQP